jgi:UDP-MurNAc hydroxylase
VETSAGSVLCDPWVSPAYFGSWFPFPDNSQLDWERFGQADFLYVSHLHRDHYDPAHLTRFVNKNATVLLPEYPTTELRDALEELGFSKFVAAQSGEVVNLDGLEVMIHALVSPADGPIGALVTRRRHHAAQPERRPPHRPVDLRRVGPRRRAPAAVLRRDLVPDGL